MKAIGIRVMPKEIYYTVTEIDENNEISISEEGVEKVILPVALDVPNRLAFIRQTFISIINEFEIENAGIRVVENVAKNVSIERVNIEGVIQELLANSTVNNYFIGTISTIAKHLSVKSTALSQAFKSKEPLENYAIDDWSSLKKEEKESLMTALAALHI
ncbi:hypothetical protein ACR0S4_17720 [Priestia megaterium]|uniref:hypothetical protein n=1 Tax=Priestia megaterium TaxID=1404 RepID=UPI003D984197